MKKTLLTLSLAASIVNCFAQQQKELDNVIVTARRPMKEIGVQKTSFDSTALKENIALSMADVLAYNSSVFVKSYGRATLSTVAFRGTSPSHTQVTWNGMRINSPMLGMTDFSTIPSFFIDKASLLHGTSSVTETGGGLGGLVKLSTTTDMDEGLNLQYIQGIGSFSTFDEFVKVSYGGEHWASSTRAVYSSSPNDYEYTNHDKKENIYDDNNNIIDQYHPTERNRSGSFNDFHILHETYYNSLRGDKFGLNVWFVNSNRELPMLTTDYGKDSEFENRQREHTLRSVLSWEHNRSSWRTALRGGYIYTWMGYDYRREVSRDNWANMTHSRSKVNTIYGQAEGEFTPSRKWYFTANLSAHQHFVKSTDRTVTIQDGDNVTMGYDKGRVEMSSSASAKWQPIERIGLSVVLRNDMFGNKFSPIIPAIFVDGLVSRRGNIMLKASASRNHKFPSINDLYFMPGGNPDLKSEHGFTYDIGTNFTIGRKGSYSLSGSATWFDSRIKDWIIWLPTTKGFFSPSNIKEVHAYGIELKADATAILGNGCKLNLSGSYSWTPSINNGEPASPADLSVGKQLPYVPRHSASVNGHLHWKSWGFLYKWCYYSQRYTMSSNDQTLTGHLPTYFMNNLAIEKSYNWKPANVAFKLAINNLFNEDYLSVLSRPMPGINFEFFVAITPKIKF